jgi:hypothetical protein
MSFPVKVWSVQSRAGRTGASLAGVAARAVRRPQPSRRRAATPGDLRLSGFHALLRQDQDEQVHGQAKDAGQAPGPKAEGNPRGDATPPHAPVREQHRWLRQVLNGHYQYFGVIFNYRSLRVFKECVVRLWRRQTQPKRPHEPGDLPQTPDCLPLPGPGDPPGMAEMIDPPRGLSEEPTAVTPHGGICGGESQQWLSYPTNPPVRLCVQRRLACSAGDRPAGARV